MVLSKLFFWSQITKDMVCLYLKHFVKEWDTSKPYLKNYWIIKRWQMWERPVRNIIKLDLFPSITFHVYISKDIHGKLSLIFLCSEERPMTPVERTCDLSVLFENYIKTSNTMEYLPKFVQKIGSTQIKLIVPLTFLGICKISYLLLAVNKLSLNIWF